MDYSDNNFVSSFLKFLNILKVRATSSGVKKFLESHPDKGSLSAYTDALNYYTVENAAFHVTIKDLYDLPTPLITLQNTDGGRFTIIKSVNNGKVVWLNEKNKWTNSSMLEFAADWSGDVLYAQPNGESGEPEYQTKRKKEVIETARIPLAISLSLALCILFILNTPISGFLVTVLLLVKLVGIVFAALLFSKSIGINSKWVTKICTSGSKVDCESILDSPAAKITSWATWSDVGFIYFLGSFIALLLARETVQSIMGFLGLQIILSSGALLFSLYSLYYQKFKAKTWCTLCLGVVTVLMTEAVLLFGALPSIDFVIPPGYLSELLIGFSIPIIFLLFFKLPLTRGKDVENLQSELKRLKTNPLVFNALMSNQDEMPILPNTLSPMAIGNPNAQHTITFISSPLCGPCAKMHLKIEELLATHTNFNCEIIFFSSPEPIDSGSKFVKKLYSLPQELREKALHQWFKRNDKNFERWNSSYKDYKENPNLAKIQVDQYNWVKEADIEGTPTLFINGTLVPEALTVEDLPLLEPHLDRGVLNNGFANRSL